ncbi:unnamed protein product [Ranitomeya imitator]|uniref:Uncharacterized protein n=1 Tax=Ranitomeya imitator TaxID=111125 RepID=A0ABN9ME59_9NEOB|nr:unnamed protein product [Ranitomeya imitator]
MAPPKKYANDNERKAAKAQPRRQQRANETLEEQQHCWDKNNAYKQYKCLTDQRKQLEETLPLILGLILGLAIVIILAVYHVHHKMTAANQVQIPRDRSLYKHMG